MGETVDISSFAAPITGEPMNLAHMIEPHENERVALIVQNQPVTFGDLRAQVDGLRGGLVGLGVQPGDHVALICGNGMHFVVSYLAVLGAGAVAIPLNPTSPARELEREMSKVRPTTVIVGPQGADGWVGVDRTIVPSVTNVVCHDGSCGFNYENLVVSEPQPIVDVDPDSVAVMMFTSGTAGAPKAAMLTHRNLRSNLLQGLSLPTHIHGDDVVYGVLPLFHIFGLNVMLGMSLTVGATLVLVQRFDPATAADTIVRRGVTVMPGAPPIWVAFAHFDELPADTFASVRSALSGASKLSTAVSQRCFERFGIVIAEGYGLTEASPVVTSSSGVGPNFGSVGRSLTGVAVRVVDANDEDVVVGDTGEVQVKGPNVFLGYFEDPEATARVLGADGWLHTGDLAIVGDDGLLYLVDRAKDLIIVSGFNVYPAEVEDVLNLHAAVAEVGVVGVAHPHTGEAVKAFVRLEDSAIVDEETLIEHCRNHLARYKCPSKILFVDELPRNVSGKLIRRELDATLLGN